MLLLPLLACHANSVGDCFCLTSPFMPTDGHRTAFYVNEDEAVPWRLVVEKLGPTELVDDVEVVTFEWTREDTGEVLGGVKWSSGDGIAIHGYAEGDGPYTMFDEPVVVMDEYMNRGESVTTQTAGYTFRSTFVDVEDCPVAWGLDWQDCTHVRVDDGDGDDTIGTIFAGDYWLVQRYGPAWMWTTGYAEKWNLADYDWEPE